MQLSGQAVTVVIPATFLFVFGIAAIGWNIVIWKQVSELRDDVYSLTNEIRRNSERYRYLQTRYNLATRMMREHKLIDRDKVRKWNGVCTAVKIWWWLKSMKKGHDIVWQWSFPRNFDSIDMVVI